MSDRPGDNTVPQWVRDLGITDRLTGQERARASWNALISAGRRAAGRDRANCAHAGLPPLAGPPGGRDEQTTPRIRAGLRFAGRGQPAGPGPDCQMNKLVSHSRSLTPLCCRHHRAKQARGWQLTQPEPGTMVWITPSGRSYVTGPAAYPG
jgi:hypothetical protein